MDLAPGNNWKNGAIALLFAASVSACGAGAELSDSASALDPGGVASPTVLGTYEMHFDPQTLQITLTPQGVSGDLNQILFMNRDQAQFLETNIASYVNLSNWYTANYDLGAQQLRLYHARVTDVHPGGLHMNNVNAHFYGLKPSTVVMTSPAADSDGSSGYYARYQSIAWLEAVDRDFSFDNPNGTAFTTGLAFEGDLTAVAPTSYISYAGTGGRNGDWEDVLNVAILGLGFGGSPTVTVGGTSVSINSASDTLILLDVQTPIAGIVRVQNGATTITGPYIKSVTYATYFNQLPSGYGNSLDGYYFTFVWNGAGVPGGNNCPPTSGLGTYDAETITDFVHIFGHNADVMRSLNVVGSGFKVYVAFDVNFNAHLDGGDFYYYDASGTTLTTSSNSLPNGGMWTTTIGSGTTCF